MIGSYALLSLRINDAAGICGIFIQITFANLISISLSVIIHFCISILWTSNKLLSELR